ncbi:cytochrome c [Reinekea sp. G2M2-21]|uniref:c-type cytochrome n=1 Tax=Reinekea sp. G2M2-21 TaxID=2788942 RepID=UPI0018AC3AEB|nr:cytochrome c [Reinekea sp. G2M2-21]
MITKNIAIASLTAVSALTFAHNGATGVVKERMDAMEAIGDANLKLTAISRGREAFDLDIVVASAQTIAQHSGESLLALFPEGSLDEKSESRAAIWEDWSEFSSLAYGLETTAKELSQISDESEFNVKFRAMAKNCGGCHQSFRAKK